MIDLAGLSDDLAAIGLSEWHDLLAARVRDKLADGAHGDLQRWRAALANLPAAGEHAFILDAALVSVGPPGFDPDLRATVREQLKSLIPWRKGPFRVGDIVIDAEWRSDLKWARVAQAIAPLDDRLVLDVGCGNGYYALRMVGAGARAVIGIDPTLVHLAQFQAIRHWLPKIPAQVLPLRLNELPPAAGCFDTVFSMGVLYHQREPLEHLAQLRDTLRAGGELVLETLVLPGEESEVRQPQDRYARMRNVWQLPTVPRLLQWLDQSGFGDQRLVDVSLTTSEEQRSTEWMPFESLAEASMPGDPS
ncbi:MAG TPA: tRNA 5-methoxyuridine(34)/uridine 5-oxyacetic acid(34) synthase CmoB, partial [Woeseiaceae bacterium]